ncbi:hypothetical protein MMC17_006689 [Xylographa soralifera]|nr:hypothetical protein [Xylographa soralifera]
MASSEGQFLLSSQSSLYYHCFYQNLDSHTDRRVLPRFIANMTPLCADAIATTAAGTFAVELKQFLQAHLLGEIYFFASMQSPDPPGWDTAQNHPPAELAFSLGFHLSYVALRNGATLSDARGVRQSYSMIELMGDSEDILFYYDAQISFLITGTDEGHWTAYCIADNYMGTRESIEEYVTQNADGPSGGALKESQLCCSPEEYFLLVLSKRIKQTTQEWGNVTSTLMERLDAYESHYIRIIDSGDLRDDTDMALTRSYMKAVSILHQLHDTLSTQLDSLRTFLDEEMQVFESGDKISSGRWKYYLDRIWRNVANLRKRERRLMQRLNRFNEMKDGVRTLCVPLVIQSTLTFIQADWFLFSFRKSPINQAGR